jgi:hypothetical protein
MPPGRQIRVRQGNRRTNLWERTNPQPVTWSSISPFPKVVTVLTLLELARRCHRKRTSLDHNSRLDDRLTRSGDNLSRVHSADGRSVASGDRPAEWRFTEFGLPERNREDAAACLSGRKR